MEKCTVFIGTLWKKLISSSSMPINESTRNYNYHCENKNIQDIMQIDMRDNTCTKQEQVRHD